MVTKTLRTAGQRAGLSRGDIVAAALGYIDEHGLGALSMHKLGAVLDVKGMSLYNHVAGKDDLLDGVVDLLWQEIAAAAPAQADWRLGFRALARAIRDVMLRHPNAAPLMTTQRVMPQSALRTVLAHVTSATGAGLPEPRAYDLLRAVSSTALGTTLADLTWGTGQQGCAPDISDLLRPGTPDELVAAAEIFCGQSCPDAQFALALDLMLRPDDHEPPQ
ncbi:AcrR family transcriptional regulator [Kribbella aluminosa]|uniref:AcrR family transcriptional regulator n=1 Tax=Kribbella aluminosa TaxID=416017 RepID=A0ABS4UWH4_9ACTN|nr:TetR/AcrR family transcriptional regulator C-terminal domain-containing protein [Kribbella aluminosa]MBP2356008.1 AcrR family transcriptional regulator [Kribbella aluminosa]